MNRAESAVAIVFAGAFAIVFAIAFAMCSQDARAQSTPCCVVCPGMGGAGGAGAGGAGTGGVGGGQPAGGLTASELTLNRRVLAPGGTLDGEVTLGNTSGAPIALREVRIAARAPGASHAGGPYTDLAPVLTAVTIPGGGHVTLAASRAFKSTDATGKWEAYATYQDGAGVWHDLPSEYFVVRANNDSGGGGGDKPPTTMTVGTQEWFIASWAGTDIYKPGVDWSDAYADGDDIWNAQFLLELSGFVVFRHMDTNATNWSEISRWSQRRLPTDPGNQEVYIDGSSDPDTVGMAVEWQIDLCNRGHVDCWFTHPYLADDDYLREQAKLVKAKLNPSARVYIELSNEVWNGSFAAFDQSIRLGEEQGLPGSNQYYVGIAHELKRALEMYSIYSDVFGEAAMGSRVVRVFSESGNLDLTTQALRNVYESSEWNPHRQRIDMLAMAPYIGNGVDGANESLSRWSGEVDDKMRGDIAYAHEQHVQAYDLPMFGCYEGGMHHLQHADAWAGNPDAYDAYVYMLDRFAELMRGPCVLYTLHGDWASGGAWGLLDHVGQASSQAPKLRAAKEWQAGVATRNAGTKRLPVVVAIALVLLILLALVYWLQTRKETKS